MITKYFPAPLHAICKALVVLATLLTGCQKTELEYEKRPYKAILGFDLAGYNGLDSVRAVIMDDDILVYWDITVEKPLRITPRIVVSEAASISPASGEEVDFSESTVYTVTAEDGTIKEYRLKPVLNQAIPTLTNMTARLTWHPVRTQTLRITGEYFLAGGDTSAIQVYAKRVRDGFEFELPLIKEQVTQTNISVTVPKFTAEQDSGRHNIYVRIGNVTSGVKELWLSQPGASHLISSATFEDVGKPIFAGDTLTLTYSLSDDYGGMIARYYTAENLRRVYLQVASGNSGWTFPYDMENAVSVQGGKVRFVVPEIPPTVVGWHVIAVGPGFKFNVNATDFNYDGFMVTLDNQGTILTAN